MSRTTTGATYPTINTVGALLPPDLLTRLANGELDHLAPGTYGLPDAFTLRQAAARAWELLLPTYRSFETRLAALPDTDPATAVTRDRWTTVLLRELGYDLTAVPNIQVEDDTFDVRHLDGHVPVHMLGWNVDLDKRAATNIRGASRTAPHSLIQELLNRTDQHLWAILTNGKRLRLLRDNIVMGRPAFIEFDLEGMFTGEQFADFAILYVLAHATRLRSEQPSDCILEQWRTTAITDGTRALDHLRDGVVEALRTLGTGFLEHPDNVDLRDLIAANHGATDDYYRWLLRLVYRLIFLFVAEDRDLLHAEDTPKSVRQRYADYFSTQHLRELATRRRAGRHADAWAALRLVFDALGSDGEPLLGLPSYGSDLFNPGFIGALHNARISNERLLAATRSLSQLPDRATGTLRPVDYKNLGAEELGSVYEALLEYVPTLADDGQTFALNIVGGNARKTSGSYYTPTDLVELLLDETLDPVLDRAAASAHPVEALLSLTVCDPACGSGHFLVAAARRIARRVATARTGDPEPTPDAMREALRDVVARCLYGVDLSDLAAELAKVSLWLESLRAGQPLAFLDAHIKVGNALLGATPRLLVENIPDVAFEPLEGDDDPCALCASRGITQRITVREANRGMEGCSHTPWSAIVKSANKAQREASEAMQGTLLSAHQVFVSNEAFAKAAAAIEEIDPTDISAVREKADAWRRAEADPNLVRAKQVADAWCAAFMWPLTREHARQAPTHEVLLTLQEREDLSPLAATREGIERLARRYRYFHWHLEFPQVFSVPEVPIRNGGDPGWTGGFSVVLGNPPWDRVRVQESEFFEAAGRPEIAKATGARRREKIRALASEDEPLYAAFGEALRDAGAMAGFIRSSGRYPLSGVGELNTFAMFVESASQLLAADGQLGQVVPSGIATDSPTKDLFADLSDGRLSALLDFDNRKKIFPAVHSMTKFSVLVATGRRDETRPAKFAFFLQDPKEAKVSERWVSMTANDIALLNPNTRTCPVFRTVRHAEVTLSAYRRLGVLDPDSEATATAGWGFTTQRGLEVSRNAAGFIFDEQRPNTVRLYESKMAHLYDHRWANLTGTAESPNRSDPKDLARPKNWVSAGEVKRRIVGDAKFLTGLRRTTNATNERTLIPLVLPPEGVADNITLFKVRQHSLPLVASFASLACDFLARVKLGGANMNAFVVRQLAVPTPETFDRPCPWSSQQTLAEWILPRALELLWTAEDLNGLAADAGLDGGPYKWDASRRRVIRAELDAAFLHVYGYTREDAEFVLDDFPILREAEIQEHGCYALKELILTLYDEMFSAINTGQSFTSALMPAPGQGPRHA